MADNQRQDADLARRKRWPNPPPKGQRCDASMGYSTDQCGAPVLNRCPNLAAETGIQKWNGHETWLCLRCIEHLASKGTVIRNPKKFPRLIDGTVCDVS